MTFFIVLSLLFAIRAANEPSLTNFVLSGVLAGLATSTKYNAGLVVLSLVVAGWIAFRRGNGGITLQGLAGKLLAAGLGMTLAFALTSPYVVLRQAAVVRDLGNLVSLHYQPESEWALWTHLRVTLPGGLGWSFLGVALAGLLRALWLRRTADWVLLAFFLPYFVFVSSLSSAFPRYLVPLTPLFAVFGADLINAFPRASMGTRSVVFALGLLVLCGPGLWSSIQFDRLASAKDTRLQAAEWVAQNVAPQTEILLCRGYGAPHINKDRRRPPAFRPTIINCFTGRPRPAATPYLITHEHPSLSNYSRVSHEVRAWLEQQGEQLVVFSPFENPEPSAAIFHPSDAFYLPFSGFAAVERGGPIVRIWKLREGSSS
jgi:4-amino-4-deoxy-L-arabinose transferase-like glycosyltransferase